MNSGKLGAIRNAAIPGSALTVSERVSHRPSVREALEWEGPPHTLLEH